MLEWMEISRISQWGSNNKQYIHRYINVCITILISDPMGHWMEPVAPGASMLKETFDILESLLRMLALINLVGSAHDDSQEGLNPCPGSLGLKPPFQRPEERPGQDQGQPSPPRRILIWLILIVHCIVGDAYINTMAHVFWLTAQLTHSISWQLSTSNHEYFSRAQWYLHDVNELSLPPLKEWGGHDILVKAASSATEPHICLTSIMHRTCTCHYHKQLVISIMFSKPLLPEFV